MDVRQLECFIAVAEERSFTKAAHRLCVVQSAVSAMIRRLESELGCSLFVRDGRGVTLTDAGELMLVRSRVVVSELARTAEAIDAIRDGVAGHVTMGTILSAGSLDLAQCLRRFHTRHPGVQVRLQLSAGPMNSHLRKVIDGTFDLSLVPIPPRIPDGVVIEPIGRAQMGLACPAHHPLAAAVDVRYRDVAAETFIDFPAEWGNRGLVDGLFRVDGVERTVSIEVTSVESALSLVRGGLGLAFVPRQFIGGRAGVAEVALREPPPRVAMGLARSRTRRHTPAATALFDAIVAAQDLHTVLPG